ncbi:MAG: hypothetical protein IKF45_06685 [Lachnospiraceae bacterium]|nr:hypothetical protein [Lachnospiraceae bacterium]
MLFFGPKDTYSTPETARKTRDKAQADHSYDRPAAAEKLLKKIPAIKDDNKLFYYAMIDRPEVRAAAIAALTDPKAIHMAVQLFEEGNYDALRNCVDNPHIAEGDIYGILRSTAGFITAGSLRRYIIAEKLHSEKELVDFADSLVDPEDSVCAISRLKQKKALLELTESRKSRVIEAAADRYRELYPEDADRDISEIMLRQLKEGRYFEADVLWGRLQLSDSERQNMEKEILSALSSDPRLQPKKEKNSIGISVTPEASMSIMQMMPVVRLLETITPGKALYSFVRNWKTSSVLPEKNKYAADQAVLDVVMPKLTREQLTDLIAKHGEKCPVAGTFALRILAKDEDGPQIILDAFTEISKKDTEDRKKLRNFLWSIDDDRALGFLLDNTPADSKERELVAERILWVSKSEDLIVRCLTEYDMDRASAIFNLSEEGRKTLALSARNAGVRSEAAKTLQKTGHVRVLRDRCVYCGAEVTSELILKGTIEAHYLYRCTGCGRTEHETILGPVTLKRDIYVYEP